VLSFFRNELEPIAYLIYMAAAILFYNSTRLLRHKVLFYYYGFSAVLIYLGILFLDNNNWNYNVIFLLNICVLSWYFYSLLCNKVRKTIIVFLCAGNALLIIYTNVVQQKYLLYNNYVYAFSFISIVLYALFYLLELLNNIKEDELLINFDFWLVSGYLIYFLGSFVIVLLYDDNRLYSKRGSMWQMHNIILFICSLITGLASVNILLKRKVYHV